MKRTLSAIDDLPEEILPEIISRLGFKPLFRCKCVSKLWNSVISDPKFRKFYLQRLRSSPKSSPSPCYLSAVLYPNVNCRGVRGPSHGLPDGSRDLIASASIVQEIDDDVPPSLYVTSFQKPGIAYHIKASSNGLILSLLTPQHYPCIEAETELKGNHQFCVSNPLTGHSVKLPTLWIPDQYTWAYGLATRAHQPEVGTQDCFTYKVVLFHIFSIGFVQIDIFSSDTGRWTRKERMSCPDVVSYGARKRAFSYKGILHFFDRNTRTVGTYDAYHSPDRFGSIKLPSVSGKKVMNSGFNLICLGHEELLEFGEIEDCGDGVWRLFVWRLMYCDKIEWCLKKKCSMSPFWGVLSNSKLLVAPDPLNDEFLFYCFLANNKKILLYNLASAKEVSFDPFEVQEESTSFDRLVNELVPVALNPWSSPFHGEAGRSSSSKPGYGKIIPAWFPSFAK